MLGTVSQTIDYSGMLPECAQFHHFGDAVVQLLRRSPVDSGNKVLLVVDKGFGLGSRPFVAVHDHINLTGSSPLMGPNDPIGPRFTVINGIYGGPPANDAPAGIAAGIKEGCSISGADADLIASLGADCWCYNLVPTMQVAAHAGWKVVAFLVAPQAAEAPALVRQCLAKPLEIY